MLRRDLASDCSTEYQVLTEYSSIAINICNIYDGFSERGKIIGAM
jgi:hypothetical protein